ncbi:MAG TPA: enoyl-CoA hydratase-related protein, partial [Arenicellales bacterium]|nr:enoyl-CoA hydratase-related protein [Arenicellales bacterium]
MSCQDILVESRDAGVQLITLNRPKVRNALRTRTLEEIADILEAADADPDIRVCVMTGSDGHFAAGADIKEMAGTGAVDVLDDPRQSHRRRIDRFGKPLIA